MAGAEILAHLRHALQLLSKAMGILLIHSPAQDLHSYNSAISACRAQFRPSFCLKCASLQRQDLGLGLSLQILSVLHLGASRSHLKAFPAQCTGKTSRN